MSTLRGLHLLKIDSLELDPQNPRLPERLINAPETDVLKWMLTDATLTDLMASIVENGFFGGESLIGIEDIKNPGKFIIVEGNRRLAAIKVLAKPELAEYKTNTVKDLASQIAANGRLPEQLPVFVVNNREEVANYLGYRHVTGVKQWPVIAKARYLYGLFKTRPYSDDIYWHLANEIGSKSDYVRRLIVGYQLFAKIEKQNFYDLDDLNEENFDLSPIINAATRHAAIEEYMGIEKSSPTPLVNLKEQEFENVFRWLYEINEEGETRIGGGDNLGILNKILSTDLARERFLDSNMSLAEAAEFTSLVNDILRNYLSIANANIAEAQKVVHRIVLPAPTDIKLAEEIKQSAEAIQTIMIIARSKKEFK